jgi:carbonic anhydrase
MHIDRWRLCSRLTFVRALSGEEAEKKFFAARTGGDQTDINIMELVVAVLAIVVERDYLSGKVVILRVNNTTAVAWLNKHRLNHMWGQGWMRLLTMVSLHFNIRIMSIHIAGAVNSVAKGFPGVYRRL